MAKSFSLLYAEFMGPWEVTGNRYEASGSFPTWPVREYSARNCSTERISITDSLVGLGGEAWGPEAEVATAEVGGADAAGGEVGRGEVGRGEVGRGEVGRGEVGRGEVGFGEDGRGGDGRGEAGRGEVGGGDVDRLVVAIGEVVVMTGEVVGAVVEATVVMGDVWTGAEIGSEARGGEGGIGSPDCTRSPPTAP